MTYQKEKPVDWEDLVEGCPFKKRYNTQLLDYKDAARKSISEELGFEPKLKSIMFLSEFECRVDLKRYDDGLISKEELEESITRNATTINNEIIDNNLEQKDLALKYLAVQYEVWKKRFEHRYENHLIEYKDQARQMLIDELGFEPNVYASALSEMLLRLLMQRHDDDKITKQELNDYKINYALDIKNTIIEEHPDQKDLALKYNKPRPNVERLVNEELELCYEIKQPEFHIDLNEKHE